MKEIFRMYNLPLNISQIRYNAEIDRYVLDGIDLCCGDMLEVLIYNGITQKEEWIETRIELDGDNNWYLVGLIGYQINGLFARII